MAMKMMTTLCSILAIWAVRNVDFATSHHAPSPSVNCSSLVLNMTECLTYVTNGSTVEKPEGSCCSGLKTVLKVDAECLCEAFKNSAHLGVTLNVTKALTLPSACRISAPPVSNCGYENSTSPPSPIPMESSTSPPSPILIAESPSSTIYGTSLLEGDLSPLNIYGGSQYEPSPSPPIYGGSQYEPSPSPTIPSPTISGGSQNNKTAPSPTISGRSKNKTWLWIVLSVVGCSSVVAALVWLGCWMKRKRRENEYPTATATATDTDSDYKSESVIVPIRQLPHNELVSTTTITSSGQLAVVLPRQFTLNELVAATNNFADEKLLGQGGFGMVYEGLFGKSKVAVKRITQKSKQGKKEYESEVKTISRLRHRNLVQLMGWCHEKYELLIVYEFMPNKSLASALLYLQEECEQYVLHRDIKSSNVLLDSNFNAKLGDFGLARLVDHGEMSRATLVVGTRGYMAPEYFESNKARKESDVYSFGIVALEIACGKRAIFQAKTEANDNNKLEIKLVELVWEQYGNGNVLKVADPRLGGNYDENQMERLLVVGLWCAHPDYKSRPNVKQAMDVLLSKDPLPLLPLTMPVPIFFSPSVNMSETSPTSQSQISSTGWNTTSGSHSQISSTGWNTTSGSHSQISGTGANTTLESQSRISGTGWNTSSGSQSQISSTGWNTNWLEH